MGRRVASLTVGVLLGGMVLAATPGPAAADFLDTQTATTTYELVPSKGVVAVTTDLRVENHTSDVTEYVPCIQYQWDPYWGSLPYATTCPRTTRTYIDSAAFWVEDAAQSLRTTADSGSVSLSLVKKDAGYRLMKATFKRIFSGQVRKLHVTYSLPGGKPRSSNPMRAGAAYAAFCATGNGTDGGSVRVIIPSSYKTVTAGDAAKATTSGSKTVYDSGPLSDPADYYFCLSGTNEAGLKATTVTTLEGRPISIESWPEDAAWRTAIESQLTSSVSGLESLVGSSLPGSGMIHVREVAALDLGDYAGVYDPDTQVAQVAEDAIGSVTLPHELAHVWFNHGFLADTWLDEGYAEWAARAVSPGIEPSCSDPGTYPGTGGPSLAQWTTLSGRPTAQEEQVVAFNYDAACYIITDAAATVGPAGMRQALQYLSSGRIPYLEDSAKRESTDGIGWRTWLDAIDEDSGTKISDPDHLQSLLARFGVTIDEAELTARSAARLQLLQLRTQVVGWRLPAFLGEAMADWRFDDATAGMTAAADTRTTTAAVSKALPPVDAVNGPVKALFEKSTSLADLRAADAAAHGQLEAAQMVAAALAAADASKGPLEIVGLLATDLKGQEAAAIAAVAEGQGGAAKGLAAQLDQEVTGATSGGALRVGFAVALVALLAGGMFLLRRARARARLASATVSAAVAPGDLLEASLLAPATDSSEVDRAAPPSEGAQEGETAALACPAEAGSDPLSG